MRLIAATCSIVFMSWSILAAFDGHRILAIAMGALAGLAAIAFISLTFREEFRKTDDWLGKGDDD